MHIGSCRMTFRLHGNDSLKGKRQVSRSLITKLRQKFNLSVAEVDGIDMHQTLVIGMCCVSKDASYAQELIDAAVRWVEAQHVDADRVSLAAQSAQAWIRVIDEAGAVLFATNADDGHRALDIIRWPIFLNNLGPNMFRTFRTF